VKLRVQEGLRHGHIVLDGDPVPPPQKGHSPQFLPMSCGQMAGWIKMPLGMEVGLDPGDIVLDGDPTPPKIGDTAPPILVHVLWPNSCMDKDATWYGGRPRPRPYCVTWGPSFPH